MLYKELGEHMIKFINKFNGGTPRNIKNIKQISGITEDHVRYFLYITVLLINVAVTIKHKDLAKLELSKILNGDCEPGFLNFFALSPLSPISLPKTCQNYMLIKSAMKQVLSTNVIEFIYPIIIFFAGLITSGSYIKITATIINTMVSILFNRVKTDGEKDEKKQKNMEDDVIKLLQKMSEGATSNKIKEKSAVESLLFLNSHSNTKKKKKTSGGKSKKKKTSEDKSKKKNKTSGGKSKKNKTKKNKTRKN
jgi:hypothetical protein